MLVLYVCIYTYIYIYTDSYNLTYIHSYIYTHFYTNNYIPIHLKEKSTHTCMCLWISTFLRSFFCFFPPPWVRSAGVLSVLIVFIFLMSPDSP